VLLKGRPLKTQPKAVNCTSKTSLFCSTIEPIQPAFCGVRQPAFCGDMVDQFSSVEIYVPHPAENPNLACVNNRNITIGRNPKCHSISQRRCSHPIARLLYQTASSLAKPCLASVSNSLRFTTQSCLSMSKNGPTCYFRLFGFLDSGAAGNALVGGGAGGCIGACVKIGLVGGRRKELPGWIGPSSPSDETLALYSRAEDDPCIVSDGSTLLSLLCQLLHLWSVLGRNL
jgi:hypothetical protein